MIACVAEVVSCCLLHIATHL
jgi:hypothetical protein